MAQLGWLVVWRLTVLRRTLAGGRGEVQCVLSLRTINNSPEV